MHLLQALKKRGRQQNGAKAKEQKGPFRNSHTEAALHSHYEREQVRGGKGEKHRHSAMQDIHQQRVESSTASGMAASNTRSSSAWQDNREERQRRRERKRKNRRGSSMTPPPPEGCVHKHPQFRPSQQVSSLQSKLKGKVKPPLQSQMPTKQMQLTIRIEGPIESVPFPPKCVLIFQILEFIFIFYNIK